MTEPQGSRGAGHAAGTTEPGGVTAPPPRAASRGASAAGGGAGTTSASAGTAGTSAGTADWNAAPGSHGEPVAGRPGSDWLAERFSNLWLVLLGAAVAMVAVGVIILVWPAETLFVLAVLIGAALLVTGVLKLVEGFAARAESGGMRVADVVIGLLAIVAGLYCLRHHDLTLVFVALVVGIFWVVHGITDVAIALSSGPMPGRWLMGLAGLLSIVAGVLVTFWPGISLLLLLWFLGVWLIVYGIVLAGRAMALRHELRSVSGPARLRPA
ncbi:MAG TPA: DUF308 domain-containing protein [Streptosporangiaceae bacterium]|jgi:uncharacterized membrane protein HdeD (DUF308 family)